MLQPLFFHWRFACKLTFAILLALVLGFHFQLQTPRWSVLTAAIVTAGSAVAPAASLLPAPSATSVC
ncbi:hypothetical protein D8L93_07075 [Sodalis-like symbiont of Bactericera trigonica]|nr:hypothetical protein D8L93_07075 [Sodalis-like symbiont of Bactericera trigonica]